MDLKCKICSKEFKLVKGLVSHFRQKHHLSSKEYYDKYLKKENEDICLVCGDPTYYQNIVSGYRIYCSNKCSSNSLIVRNKFKITCYDRFGCGSPSENIEIRQKQKDTCMFRYGVENPNQLEKIKQKKKYSYLKKYGVDNPNKSKYIKEKKKKTCMNKYGVENPSQIYSVRLKLRNIAINRVEMQKLNGEPLMPNIGDMERPCLNEIQKHTQYKIIRNPRMIGYFPDGYIEELKLVIEFDERHHFIDNYETYKPYDIQKDEDYMKYGFKCIRIKKNKWEQNKNLVISEFKSTLENINA